MISRSTFTLSVLLFLCFSLTNAQEVKINNNFVIESDGTPRLDGNASVFDDLMVYPDATTKGASNAPTWTKFTSNGGSQGVFLWGFDPLTEQELYFTVQIPHKYKLGTPLYPHVHWTTLTGIPNGSNVVWGLEYNIIKIGEVFSSTTTIITTNSIISSIGTPKSVRQHLISPFPDIAAGTAPNDIDISSVIMCRLYRIAGDSRDTFASPVFLLGFDFHYEIDTEGSRTQYTK